MAAPVVDTVWLARRLLAGRTGRFGLSPLAHFFGTSVAPCHRALADASATAEILIALIGLAQERGAETVADLVELSAPRARRLHAKRSLVAGAPTTPGTYLFRDAHGQALYVGRARNLSARLRSYFSGERQRPAVEAALGALARVEWQRCGSELEAALDELGSCASCGRRRTRAARGRTATSTCGDGRPLGLRHRADGARADRRARGWRAARRRRSTASRATIRARCSRGCGSAFGVSPTISGSRTRRGCATGSPRSSRSSSGSTSWDASGAMRACLVVPALEPGMVRAIFLAGGVVARRTVPRGGGARLEVEAGLVEVGRRLAAELEATEADELLLLAGFMRRPPPELQVLRSTAMRSSRP